LIQHRACCFGINHCRYDYMSCPYARPHT
jgi:hypothetical protein